MEIYIISSGLTTDNKLNTNASTWSGNISHGSHFNASTKP